MGEGVLIDTDVLIDYVRGRRRLPEGICYISEITLYEFIRGTRDPREAKRLLEREFVVIYCDNEILELAAETWRKLRRKGVLIEDRDLIIGSTAIAKGLPLLTGNVKHFERLKEFGLKLYKD
ncbi:MAG: type II toxin-antitoxin system VapC family toxin [Thermoprotei archaeon]|nr:MAG: type II toxin-antitoxin system VapC family toxin [Thermoprotei archaeon]